MMGYSEEQELDLSWLCCLLEDIPEPCCDATIPRPIATDYPFCSSDPLRKSTKESCVTLDGLEECFQKRDRGGLPCQSSSKACREKLRRDRVNERFLELNAILEPGKTPKLDKATVLMDAAQMVKLLQDEISTLKSQNVELKQKINQLKAEKNKLRSKKHKLKLKKDHLEPLVRTLGVPLSMSLPPAPYAIPKQMPLFSYPVVPMWHFAAHASLNNSKDHVLHRRVA